MAASGETANKFTRTGNRAHEWVDQGATSISDHGDARLGSSPTISSRIAGGAGGEGAHVVGAGAEGLLAADGALIRVHQVAEELPAGGHLEVLQAEALRNLVDRR